MATVVAVHGPEILVSKLKSLDFIILQWQRFVSRERVDPQFTLEPPGGYDIQYTSVVDCVS